MKKVSTTEKGNRQQGVKKQQKGKSNKRVGSIQTKLLGIMIPLMALTVLSIMVINYFSTKREMTDSAYQNLDKESYTNAKIIESWSDSILSTLETVKNTLININFISQREEKTFLQTTVTLSTSIPNGIYEGNNRGDYLSSLGNVLTDIDVLNSTWYKEGLQNEDFAYGMPFLDPDSGSYIVQATSAILARRETVVCADVYLDEIAKEVATTKVLNCDSGYAFLVDTQTGAIMAHQNQSLVGTTLSGASSDSFMTAIAKNIANQKYDVQPIEDRGTTYLIAIDAINGTNWVLVSCVSQGEVLGELQRMQFVYAVIAVAIFLVTALIIGFVIKGTVAPVKSLTTGISRIANGDFTVDIALKGNDEITVMSAALRDYIEKMNAVIGEIIAISRLLKEKSKLSNETAVSLNETAESQSRSMADMKNTISQLTNAVTEVAQNASSLAEVVNVTNTKGVEANENMKKTVDVADKGYRDMQNVQDNMLGVVNAIQELADVVENVGKSTSEINNILTLIEDIASQTNLLSLNASIEAARAGESGRGFAVVANEIGHLADVSTNSTRQIGQIITMINEQVENMVKKTKVSVESIEENSQAVQDACGTFQKIYEDISKSNVLINAMLEEIRQVDDVATNMAAISEEQSASAQEVMATIELLATNSGQLAEESKQVEEGALVVSESALSLEESMNQFKVK